MDKEEAMDAIEEMRREPEVRWYGNGGEIAIPITENVESVVGFNDFYTDFVHHLGRSVVDELQVDQKPIDDSVQKSTHAQEIIYQADYRQEDDFTGYSGGDNHEIR